MPMAGRPDLRRLRTGFTSTRVIPPAEAIPRYKILANLPLDAPAGRFKLAAVSPSAAAQVIDLPPDHADWAVIVNHGMGQQLHFETLEEIAMAIRDGELRKTTHPGQVKGIQVGTIKLGDADLVRAEMVIHGEDGRSHAVHVYESYWAPLTEGKVTLRDVSRFLLEGGVRGAFYLFRRFFQRWEFGGMEQFPINRVLTTLKLIIGLLVLFAPIVLANLVTVAQVAALLKEVRITPVKNLTAESIILRQLTPDVLWFEALLLVFIVGALVLPKLYRQKFLWDVGGWRSAIRKGLKALALILCVGALAGMFVVEIGFLWHAWRVYIRHVTLSVESYSLPTMAAIWLVALVAALVARWFLIQYVGDVAAYVSAYKLSKFEELRTGIAKRVYEVSRAVYHARKRDDSDFQYQKIIVVGHSLGSVISYDALNRLLLDDHFALANADLKAFVNVSERTKMLLTFGSPLDKIAFLFRTRKVKTDELRESAAAAVQPLILDYRFRPDTWVNIYSWADIISAPLNFYDTPQRGGGAKRIKNKPDKEAWVPLTAHTEYWHNALLGDELYEFITG